MRAWYLTGFRATFATADFSVAPAGSECSTIGEIALGDPNFSTLVTALTAATEAGGFDFLGAVTNPDADLTVFAPTNDAFAALDPAVLDAALADPAGLLTTVLAYHVLGTSEDAAALLAAGTATTLANADVTIEQRGDNVFINDSQVLAPNIDACNGIVHVINNVLLPPAPEPPTGPECSTIGEIALGDPNFSTLVTALTAATEAGGFDFLGAVTNPDADLTVFAPTNDAFAALDPAVLDAALADPAGLLTTVLAYHVLGTSEDAAALLAAGTATTLANADVTIEQRGDNVFINDSQVLAPNIDACNGIVHVINNVLLPPAPEPPTGPECSTIGEIALGDPNFSTLVTALTAATEAGGFDFLGAVTNPDADLTVFAPTNDAFAALDPAVLDAALADPAGLLTTVLAYHVLGTSEDAAALLAAGTATTLANADVTIEQRGDNVFINDSQVLAPNIDACNGIVHVINNVLLPPAPEPPADTVIADGNVVLLRNVGFGRFLDADRRNVDLGSTIEDDNKWQLVELSNGNFRLLNVDNGRYLDADRRFSGYNVDTARRATARGAEWEFIAQGDGVYLLRTVDFNRFLDGDRYNVDTGRHVRDDTRWEVTLAD